MTRFRLRGALSVLFGVALLAMLTSQGPGPLHSEVVRQPVLSLALVAAGFALAAARTGATWGRRLRIQFWRLPERRFLLLLGTAGFALYMASAWLVLCGSPRLDDEVAALFQARIFAMGRIVLPLPPEADFFEVFGVLGGQARRGHWCGMYPPGWPALLVPGVVLGIPWITNPLLGAFFVVAVAQLGRELYGRRIGRVAGVFALASPLVFVLAGTQLSTMPTALFACWSAVAALRLLRTARWGWGLLAGLSFGVAFLCRPLTGLVVGLAIAVLVLARWRQALRAWRGIVCAAGVALLAAGALSAFQHVTTGRHDRPGHEVGMGTRGRYGFGRLDRARTHTVELGVEYSRRRFRVLNDLLQGWPLGAFALAVLPWLLGRSRRPDAWLLLPCAGLVGAFLPYWYYDMYFPGQYVAESSSMLLVLMSRGWRELARATSRRPPWRMVPRGLILSGGLFVAFVSGPAYLGMFHAHYGDVEAALPRVVRTYGISNAVVFMDGIGEGTDAHDPRNKYYATGFMRNDLALTGSVIYAGNRQDDNVRLAKRYPGRAFYLYRFNRTTSRAQLYRMDFDARGYHLAPVVPIENEWLEEAPSEESVVHAPP